MKPDIHPDYHKVVSHDFWFGRGICFTMVSKETKTVEGEELPLVRLDISSESHPFWTGKLREMDADGRIDCLAQHGRGKTEK